MTAMPTSAKCDRCKVRRVLLLAYVASVGKVVALCAVCNAHTDDAWNTPRSTPGVVPAFLPFPTMPVANVLTGLCFVA